LCIVGTADRGLRYTEKPGGLQRKDQVEYHLKLHVLVPQEQLHYKEIVQVHFLLSDDIRTGRNISSTTSPVDI
jgi:hypothetical protein